MALPDLGVYGPVLLQAMQFAAAHEERERLRQAGLRKVSVEAAA